MTLADIAAILSNEPFNRPMSEIKRLTLFQLYNVLLRSRDRKTGKLDFDDVDYGKPLSERQRLRLYCILHRLPTYWVIEKHRAAVTK